MKYVVPGDKSITHRALFFGALSGRRTIIRNPSPADDCRNTLLLLRSLGYHITEGPDFWEIDPSRRASHPAPLTLDCGNSGTTARLAAGFLTGERGEFLLTGDASLSRRPMERVAAPLRRLGGNVTTTDGIFPVSVIADGGDRKGEKESGRENEKVKSREERGNTNEADNGTAETDRRGADEEANERIAKQEGERRAEGNERREEAVVTGKDVEGRGREIREEKKEIESTAIEVGSAQVHTALVLAAARSADGALLRRTKPMRDHTLRMSRFFGIEIERRGDEEFVRPMKPEPADPAQPPLEFLVPGDFSSAAFLVAAALLLPESDLVVEHVGLNPTRISFLEALQRMGGNLEWRFDEECGEDCEPSGTIRARYTPVLEGIFLDQATASPSVALMMDELPLLALVASQATGETVVCGAAELRVKESDRIAATAGLLRSIGIVIEELEDGFVVFGPQVVRGGATVDHHGDHRLAMLAGIAGLIAREPVIVPSREVAAVSWPDFWNLRIFD